MKSKVYNLLLKTGDAEFRALENFKDNKNNVFPIVELTRGRKSKIDTIGLVKKRLDKLKSIFKDMDICLDLTTSSDLTSSEINDLYSYSNGYQNWIDFLKVLDNGKSFKSITPVILVDTQDPDLASNLISQVKKLTSSFDSLAYRNSISDDGCYEDLDAIKDIISKSGKEFYFIIDCEYIAPGAWKSFASKAIKRIEKIDKIISNVTFIIISSSFPNNVSDIGRDDHDSFPLNEISLFLQVERETTSSSTILYGDYGSINPIRNDTVSMTRGWIPRIDVALRNEIFYYRERRGTLGNYSATYTKVARKAIADPRFPISLETNWGVEQILNSSNGGSPGSNPSFWISVRMNIHIHQQLIRLASITR